MLKKVALISSFCDSQKKLEVLEKNIRIVKSHNIDVVLISPFYLDKTIVDLCDYFFLTKDNLILEWPERSMYHWWIVSSGNSTYKITATNPDYGFAGLYQVKQLSEISLNLGYEQFFHMIYDLRIDDNVISGFYSDKSNSVYPSKRENTIWAVGLHYMIFNKENLQNFASKITKESYIELIGADAFVWLHNKEKILNYTIEQTPVEDEIYYYQEHDFFNFSPVQGLKFFVEKNDETLEPIKLLFYDNINEQKVSLIIQDEETEYTINHLDIIDLGFNKTNLKKVKLKYQNEVHDISQILEKIKHNTLEKL
jgi:hypothetical protein